MIVYFEKRVPSLSLKRPVICQRAGHSPQTDSGRVCITRRTLRMQRESSGFLVRVWRREAKQGVREKVE